VLLLLMNAAVDLMPAFARDMQWAYGARCFRPCFAAPPLVSLRTHPLGVRRRGNIEAALICGDEHPVAIEGEQMEYSACR
jgi:hypothetical protein